MNIKKGHLYEYSSYQTKWMMIAVSDDHFLHLEIKTENKEWRECTAGIGRLDSNIHGDTMLDHGYISKATMSEIENCYPRKINKWRKEL